MIEFMVLGAPRSGTAWAANWLSTDRRLCIHEPLFERHYTQLDGLSSKKQLGIACTGLALFPDFVNAHPAKKIILHRPFDEIDESLSLVGLPRLKRQWWNGSLEKVQGLHLGWRALFLNPEVITGFLFGEEPDEERHAQLRKLNVQANLDDLVFDRILMQGLVDELSFGRSVV